VFDAALRQIALYWLKVNEASPQHDGEASAKVPPEPEKPGSRRKGHAA